MRFTFLTLVLSFVMMVGLRAQVEESAPEYNPVIRKHLYLKSLALPDGFKSTEGDTLNIPFLDDFSYEGPYPSDANWCDQGAYVNPAFSYNPPSVGVATLDGLAKDGSPYGVSGSSDSLTSKAFFLGGYDATDKVYLSFYYQAKGWGDKPEVADSLLLEFKDMEDNWNRVAAWGGIDGTIFPGNYIPDFAFHSVALSAWYLYDGFQFRFRNYSSGKGQIDLWHVDYVRLTANAEPTENFNDVAFTEEAPTFLKDYTAMPWQQFAGFESQELSDTYNITLYNHFPVVQEIQNRVYTIREVGSGNTVLNTNYLTDAGPPVPLGNVEEGYHIAASKAVDMGDYSSFVSNITGLFAGTTEGLTFESEFSFDQSGQDPALPASFDNDIIRRKTIFSDYFAYDDGTSESNVKAQNTGTQVAVKYHLNQSDELRALQMHIPHVAGDVSLQLFNIKVWLDLGDGPVYEAVFERPDYVDHYVAADTLQGFTTYVLQDILGDPTPLSLPPGEFYIGWQQVTATDTPIPVGFDKNNPDAGQFNFFNAGGGWEAFPESLQGAIMIRPVFGEGELFNTSVSDLDADERFNIYPNPANDILRIDLKSAAPFSGQVAIHDLSGRQVHAAAFGSSISVSDWANGIYFVSITDVDTGNRYWGKVVVQP